VLAGVPWAPVTVGLITAAAFALRLSQLHQSLFGDEVLALHEISGHSLSSVLHVVRTGAESSPPLFFVLAWLSAKLGDPTVWIRLPSLVLGAATIPLLYLLALEAVGRAAGVIGAAILAGSPFATFYGVEARPYATLAFLTALSTLALLRAVRTGRGRWWALYAASAAGAAYTHYTAIFVLATQGAWSLWAVRGRWRTALAANAAAAALYAPWAGEVHGSGLGAYGLFEPLTAHNVFNDVLHPIAGYPYVSVHAIPTLGGLAVLGGVLTGGAVSLAWRWRRGERPTSAEPLLVALALATPVGLLLYSLLGTDIFSARSLQASVPAAVLVVGALVASIPIRLRPVAVLAGLAVLVAGTVRSIGPRYSRPAFRTVSQYIDRRGAPSDPVILYPSFLDFTSAVPAQFHRPHLVIHGIPKQWPATPTGQEAFVVVDDSMARALRIPTPHPPGFALIARRHWGGLVHFTLLTYRATGS
jgi:uncharacterized membrane protein